MPSGWWYDPRWSSGVIETDCWMALAPIVIDGQVPCSEGIRQRVRLETEQPTWFTQVPWIAWPSMTTGGGPAVAGSDGRVRSDGLSILV